LRIFPSLSLIPDCSPEQGLTGSTNGSTSLWKLYVTHSHYMAWLALMAAAGMTCVHETACCEEEKNFLP